MYIDDQYDVYWKCYFPMFPHVRLLTWLNWQNEEDQYDVYWKCNFPMTPYVCLLSWLVGQSVTVS